MIVIEAAFCNIGNYEVDYEMQLLDKARGTE